MMSFKSFLVCAALTSARVSTAQLSIQPITTAGVDLSRVEGVSSDGFCVAGTYKPSSSSQLRVFRWDSMNGFQDIGLGNGNCLSDDGTVIGGQWVDPIRWRQTTGTIDHLGTFGFFNSGIANSSSSTGNVLGGSLYYTNGSSGSPITEGFRYNDRTGMVGIGFANGTISSSLNALSSDGNEAAVTCVTPTGFMRAYRWTTTSGWQNLGNLGGSNAQALGISSDGLTVLGQSSSATSSGVAFKWKNGSMVQLGSAEGAAMACSKDAFAIVGFMDAAAMFWNPYIGMNKLLPYMKNHGATGTNGWTHLNTKVDISEDGTTIVGSGTYNGVETGFRAYRAGGWQNAF